MTDKVVLLTGATGFLGGAIAIELLEQYPDHQFLFLIRAADRAAALARVRESIAKFEPSAEVVSRVSESQMLCGDLQTFAGCVTDPRVAAITHVLNCGAYASFAWKQEIWDVNVNHTSAFAKAVATLPRIERFLHVGTAMISGKATHCVIQEDEVLDGRQQLVIYTRSKAEIERRLPELLGPVPLVVARPSVVVGHTRLGCRPSPSIFWIFRLIHLAGLVPFAAEGKLDIIPVDYCANVLARLLFHQGLSERTYHVSAGREASCSFEQIDRAYARARGVPERSLETFNPRSIAEIQERLSQWFDGSELKQVAGAVRVYQAFAGLDVCFDNTRLLREGIAGPPKFIDYLKTCVDTGESDPLTEQMVYDFR
jgi:nucleoside-diphosphate-sugar epimerase